MRPNVKTKDRTPEVHFYEWSISAWNGSTTRMMLDASGRGIYRELLDCCYRDGSIPKDRKLQSLICGTTEAEIERVWQVIGKHFRAHKNDTSVLVNLRANLFRKQFFSYKNKQRKSAKERWQNSGKGLPNKFNDVDRLPTNALQPSSCQEEEEDIRGRRSSKEEEGSNAQLPTPASPLSDPFEEFRRTFRGAIEDTAWRIFGQCVNTPELLAAITVNTPLWMQTKRYADGFFGAISFLRSGVWKEPPKELFSTPKLSRREEARQRILNGDL